MNWWWWGSVGDNWNEWNSETVSERTIERLDSKVEEMGQCYISCFMIKVLFHFWGGEINWDPKSGISLKKKSPSVLSWSMHTWSAPPSYISPTCTFVYFFFFYRWNSQNNFCLQWEGSKSGRRCFLDVQCERNSSSHNHMDVRWWSHH